MPVVRFVPQLTHVDAELGKSLLAAAKAARVPVASSCLGEGICRACRVRVVEGQDNLSALHPLEHKARLRGHLRDGERLACLAYVLGPVTITTDYW